MQGAHPARRADEASAQAGAARFARAVSLSMGNAFGASRLVLADRRTDAPSVLRVHFVNWPSWCLGHYCDRVHARDPIRAWLDSGPRRTGGSVARLSDLVPALRTVPSAFPDRRLGACGAAHVLTIALHERARVVGALSLVRAHDEGDFSDADCERARAMAPLLELAWRGANPGLVAPGEEARLTPALADGARHPALCRARDEWSLRDPQCASRGPLATLTPRERQVVALVAAGHPNKTIARELGASPWTVKNHLRAVFRKTGAANRTALGALAHRWDAAAQAKPAAG